MTTSLQRQLRVVATGAERSDDRNKPSLLFSPKEAAHMGVDLIHQVAWYAAPKHRHHLSNLVGLTRASSVLPSNGLLELQRLAQQPALAPVGWQ